MLLETILNVTARTNPALRRLGLVGDAVALWSRAMRRRRAWAPHEARCHEVVLRSVAGLPSRRTVLVLGSGLIRDVPLAFLAERFERVVLLDAVHLLPARLKARRFGAETVVADLTGAAAWLAGNAARRADPLAPGGAIGPWTSSSRQTSCRSCPWQSQAGWTGGRSAPPGSLPIFRTRPYDGTLTALQASRVRFASSQMLGTGWSGVMARRWSSTTSSGG